METCVKNIRSAISNIPLSMLIFAYISGYIYITSFMFQHVVLDVPNAAQPVCAQTAAMDISKRTRTLALVIN